MRISEDCLKQISESFDQLDFTQPHAHDVYRYLENVIANILTNHEKTTAREIAFWNMGSAYGQKHQEYYTIAPLNESEEKGKQ